MSDVEKQDVVVAEAEESPMLKQIKADGGVPGAIVRKQARRNAEPAPKREKPAPEAYPWGLSPNSGPVLYKQPVDED